MFVPIAPEAWRRRFVAVTFLVDPAALMIEPASVSIETFVAVMLPTVMLPSARRRTDEPVATTVAVPAMVSVPVSASSETVPVEAVTMSTLAVSAMLSSAFSVMWPVPERMSAFAVIDPAFASSRMLPVPFADTALPLVERPSPEVWSTRASPSLSVMSPSTATRTMLPLVTVVRSDCAKSVTTVVVASLLKSVTVTRTELTVTPLSSVT
ncbi:hypothetical protein RAHE111665_17750 [Rariglobus hedericola]